MKVTAVKDASLERVTKQTSTKDNVYDTDWNESLYFGCGKWKHIEVSMWDRDSGSDDELMRIKLFPICNSGECSVTYMQDRTKLNFNIILTPERDDCNPNPCHNGGACRDGSCGAFYCTCPSGYFGHTCQYKTGGGGSNGGGGNYGGILSDVNMEIN